MILTPENRKLLTEALQAMWESLDSADGDFCGEQREWHLPRIRKATIAFTKLFPHESIYAIMAAKDPRGEGIGDTDTMAADIRKRARL